MPGRYCLPVRALSAIFRAKCFAALQRLGQGLPQKQLPKEWVVHVRKPQQDPGSLLLYLARYVYRVAIDESRIQSIDTESVTFRYKDYRDHSKTKSMTLDGQEFLRRFLQHILPTGFVKVRHYGVFAHANKAAALKKLRDSLKAQARWLATATKAICALLRKTTAPIPPPQCPHCQSQNLVATEVMPVPEPLGQWAQAP
jgi:hypothetical protein